jgi:hypothetical protein
MRSVSARLAGVAKSSEAWTDASFATPTTAKTRPTRPGRRRPAASCGTTGQGSPKGNPSREMPNGDPRASSSHTGPRPRALATAARTRAASPTTAPTRSFELSFNHRRQRFGRRTSSRSCTSRTGRPRERSRRWRRPSPWRPHHSCPPSQPPPPHGRSCPTRSTSSNRWRRCSPSLPALSWFSLYNMECSKPHTRIPGTGPDQPARGDKSRHRDCHRD